LICLALDAHVHDVVAADGAGVHHNVPAPQGDGIPFFNLEAARRREGIQFKNLPNELHNFKFGQLRGRQERLRERGQRTVLWAWQRNHPPQLHRLQQKKQQESDTLTLLIPLPF